MHEASVGWSSEEDEIQSGGCAVLFPSKRYLWHFGTWFNEHSADGQWLDLMTLEVSSKLNDSM